MIFEGEPKNIHAQLLGMKGGQKTAKKYGKKHYQNMAKLSHKKRKDNKIFDKVKKQLLNQ